MAGTPTDIALVIDTLERGGAERVLIAIANGLDSSRFRAHVILTRRPGALATALAPYVRVHVLGRRTRWDARSLRCFAAIADRHNIRIIHTHSHSAAYFARLAKPFGRGQWLHVMHDHHGPVETSLPLRIADRLMLRQLDYYFAVSTRLMQYAGRSIGIAGTRCELLPNGVSIPNLAGTTKANVFTIVQVARLMPEKNQKMALAAAARLRAVLPQFRWLFVGRTTSAYARDCAQAIEREHLQEHVTLLGERAEVAQVLDSAHVGVLTSDYEGLPMALLEYMAAGLPVVVTDVGECGSLVRSSGGGVVVGRNDVNALTDALVRLAAEPVEWEQAGMLNRQFVRAGYSLEAMVQRVENVYDTLVSTG